jgi:DNA-binding FadR family transcriptional regulator
MTAGTPRERSTAQIRDYLTRLMTEAVHSEHGRLPTERALASRFAVPRHVVRRTLAGLEAEGTITRQVGRGTFVAGVEPSGETAAHTSPAELMEARLFIEPALAELIVTHATPADFERMDTCLDKAERAATLDEFELWDAALHQALAAATHNRFLIGVLELAAAARQQAAWGKLKDRIVTPERRLQYQNEHREIVQALKSRDAERAARSIQAHLAHARRNLFGR